MFKLIVLVLQNRLNMGFTEKYIMTRLASHLIFINTEICNKYGAVTFCCQNAIINIQVQFAGSALIGPHI